ncbi:MULTISPECIES: DUF3575 domain-containing protein [Flavobacterium]|uniref:DUF3575 domain-containing protein n=1 Tax=Flavobacterium keumense TaxID=1306518 RepID=A0ABY8N6T0_9FLAO|nr:MULTISPECIES: DUF3575 domain-containing protein [Flavobacterium]WGK95357.1 DUF3575 domain-containing protein [Flavobacterium keumense]
MKKLITTICLFSFLLSFSQDQKIATSKKYEIKGNAFLLLAGALDSSYERYLNDNSSYGASIFIAYDKDLDKKFSLTPYYRVYFGNKKVSGFFVEGFGMINNYKTKAYTLENMNYVALRNATVNDFALGFTLGGKWITKSGVIFELNAGLGRNLFYKEDNVDRMEFIGRGGIGIGYQF